MYKIVIPTYKRYDFLVKYSMPILLNNNINPDNIYIFVADEEEYNIYKEKLNPNTYKEIIIGVKGLVNQLDFIQDYFDEDEHLVIFHDDIKQIIQKDYTNPKNQHAYTNVNLKEFIPYAFNLLHELKLNMWGVNKVCNPFMMTKGYSTDLRLCLTTFIGLINKKDEKYRNKIKEDGADDIERCIIYYINDGGFIRFNDVGYMSNAITNEGGLQSLFGGVKSSIEKRKEVNFKIAEMYPNFGKMVENKNQGYVFRLHRKPKI